MSITRAGAPSNNSVANLGKLLLCVGGAIAIGQTAMWLSGAWSGFEGVNVSDLTPPLYLMGLIWSVIFGISGSSLFSLINTVFYSIRSKTMKNTAIVIWSVQFLLMLILPFFVYASLVYVLAFLTASLITAFIVAFCILSIKVSPAASLLMLPVLAWMILESYLTAILMLNNF